MNRDGSLEAEELNTIFQGLQNVAGSDKTLDETENKMASDILASSANIQDADFMGFVKFMATHKITFNSLLKVDKTKADISKMAIISIYHQIIN